MPFKNTSTRYGWITQGLHHLSALWVLGLLGLGFYMTSLDYYHPYYQTAPAWHKTAGIALAVLTLIRFAWRLYHPPPLPNAATRWQQLLALWVHRLFYVLLAALFMSGYLLSTAEGKPIIWIQGVEIPPLITGETLAKVVGEVHDTVALVLLFFIALHTLAAIKHRFFEKHPTPTAK